MIHQYTRLKVADNSGARVVMCINVPGFSRRRYAAVGDIIVCAVKETQPAAAISRLICGRSAGRSSQLPFAKRAAPGQSVADTNKNDRIIELRCRSRISPGR